MRIYLTNRLDIAINSSFVVLLICVCFVCCRTLFCFATGHTSDPLSTAVAASFVTMEGMQRRYRGYVMRVEHVRIQWIAESQSLKASFYIVVELDSHSVRVECVEGHLRWLVLITELLEQIVVR